MTLSDISIKKPVFAWMLMASLVGLRPTVPLVSRYGMLPAKPSSDTLGPIARTVTDAAIVLGVIAGYDPNDAVTAYSVGHVPDSYTSFLRRDGLKGARIGVIREPMDPKADPSSADFKQVRTVIETGHDARARRGDRRTGPQREIVSDDEFGLPPQDTMV